MMEKKNIRLANRIIRILLLFFFHNISLAAEFEKKDTLYLIYKGEELRIVEGVSNSFFDLYLNVKDSILSYKSTDYNEIYVDIYVSIDYDPVRNKFIIKWKTDRGGVFQYVEIDKLKFGNGNYFYCFSNTICSGFIEKGMKNGLETTSQEDSIRNSNYENGYKSGQEFIYYSKTGSIEERFHDKNKLLNFSVFYKYRGELLNFFTFFDKGTFDEGFNEVYSKDKHKKIIFTVKDNKISGDIILIKKTGENIIYSR